MAAGTERLTRGERGRVLDADAARPGSGGTAADRQSSDAQMITEGLTALNAGLAEIRTLLTQEGASGTGPLFSDEERRQMIDKLNKD